MIEASIVLLRWLFARARSQAFLSIRDTYIIACAAYCTFLSFSLAIIFFNVERSAGAEKPFVDCLFQVASAVTSTGLVTLDTAKLQNGSNVVLFIAMLLCGNSLLVSQIPVLLRIHRVRIARAAAATRLSALETERSVLVAPPFAIPLDILDAAPVAGSPEGMKLIVAESEDEMGALRTPRLVQRQRSVRMRLSAAHDEFHSPMKSPNDSLRTPSSDSGNFAAQRLKHLETRNMVRAYSESASATPASIEALSKYVAHLDLHARLTRALEEFLQGPDLLGYHWCLGLALAYYCTIVIAGFIAFWTWGAVSAGAQAILARNATPALPWFSLYNSLALFTNTGLIMVSDNMIQFRSETFFIVTSGVIASLGFSFYPLGLRVFIIAAHAAIPISWAESKAAVRDILDHPRKYTTHLFSANGTLVLTLMSCLTQGALFLVFLIFDYNLPYMTAFIPSAADRAMNGWFSSVMVYNAGFNTFDLSFLNQGSILFMIMCMWLTGRPFYLGIAMTAVDDGISEDRHSVTLRAPPSAWKRVLVDFIETLRTDACILVLCAMLICFVDDNRIVEGINGPTPSTGSQAYIGIVPVFFDLASAYGNVGLSLGYPNTVTSSCAMLSPFSKLVVIFMCAHGFCMGIFPSSLVNLDLPNGVDVCSTAGLVSSQDEAAHLEKSFNLVKRLPLTALLEFNEQIATAAHDAYKGGMTELNDGTFGDLAELDAMAGVMSAPSAVMLSRLTSHLVYKRFADMKLIGAQSSDVIPHRAGGRGMA
jgi:Trk-type K+ transport system membrane component